LKGTREGTQKAVGEEIESSKVGERGGAQSDAGSREANHQMPGGPKRCHIRYLSWKERRDEVYQNRIVVLCERLRANLFFSTALEQKKKKAWWERIKRGKKRKSVCQGKETKNTLSARQNFGGCWWPGKRTVFPGKKTRKKGKANMGGDKELEVGVGRSQKHLSKRDCQGLERKAVMHTIKGGSQNFDIRRGRGFLANVGEMGCRQRGVSKVDQKTGENFPRPKCSPLPGGKKDGRKSKMVGKGKRVRFTKWRRKKKAVSDQIRFETAS